MTTAQPEQVRRQALGVLMPGFVGTTLPEWLTTLLHDGLAGVCIFAHNIDTPTQLAELTASIYAANPLAIVSTDEEGGDVSRLHQRDGSPFPGNAVLGRIGDPTVTANVARAVGAQLADVGIHLALAPVADVNSNPQNPVIGVRSFGTDPDLVATHTAAWITGVQDAGVAACTKHFPGHGDTSTDSHVSAPTSTVDAATLSKRELAPFAAAIAAGTKTIMTSHIRVPALDPDNVATFSQPILGELLRHQMEFDGLIVTDALDMVGASGTIGIPAAAVAATGAGADLLCLGSKNTERIVTDALDALVRADVSGQLPAGRLVDAAGRCADLANWLAGERGRHLVDDDRPTPITIGQVIASFTMSARARAALTETRRPVRWVQIEPEENVAVGETPFGPFFDGGATPAYTVPRSDRSLANGYRAEPGELTVIVGRELHRDDGARAAAAVIAESADALIVDVGFTHAVTDASGNGGIDIATCGASRLVGEALLELVESRP